MSSWRAALVVADWEFRRYFKWKDQLIGLGFMLATGVVWLIVAAIASARGDERVVAVVDAAIALPSEDERADGNAPAAAANRATDDRRLRLVAADPDPARRAAQLAAGEVHGVLERRADGEFELTVAKDPRYRAELVELLTEVVRRERLAAVGLSAADLERILAPPTLEVRFTDPAKGHRGTPEKIAAGVLIGLMFVAIFTAMAYLMTGIASEKQLRVTESVVAAIPAQAWIDGKVLGLSAYALASTLNLVVGGLATSFLISLATDFSLPAAAVRPAALVALVLFSLLGLLLWNSFFAAVAATLDDPNTSSRSSLLMLPALPIVASLALLRDPDSLLARILALCPLTSAPAMPIRIVLSDPSWLEVGLAIALLAAAVWLMRRLAGGIFAAGMMLHGQEPSFAEIARWMLRPPR